MGYENIYHMESTNWFLMTEDELKRCGSTTLPIDQSKEGRIFIHPEHGKLVYLGKSGMGEHLHMLEISE